MDHNESSKNSYSTQTDLLIKDGEIVDRINYRLDRGEKLDSNLITVPGRRDEYNWLDIHLYAGCKLAEFLHSTHTETKDSQRNLAKSKAKIADENIGKSPAGLINSKSYSALNFNSTSDPIGPFDLVFSCFPTEKNNVDCHVAERKENLNFQIPYHNRARDYIYDQFGAFQTFVYIRVISTTDVKQNEQMEFKTTTNIISLDSERIKCIKDSSKHVP